MRIVATNPSREAISYVLRSARSDIVAGGQWKLIVPAESEALLNITLAVIHDATAGRQIVPFFVEGAAGRDSSDTFAVLEVE